MFVCLFVCLFVLPIWHTAVSVAIFSKSALNLGGGGVGGPGGGLFHTPMHAYLFSQNVVQTFFSSCWHCF